MATVDRVSPLVGVKPACQALAVPRASWYQRRSRRLSPSTVAAQRHSARALSEAEQQAVLTCPSRGSVSGLLARAGLRGAAR